MWVTRWHARNETEVRDAITLLKTHGLNTLLIQAYGDGMALYPSQVAPRSHLVSASFDQLELAIRLAQAEGIEVHAWLNVDKVWSGGLGTPRSANHIVRAHPEWSMVDSQGRRSVDNVGVSGTTVWMCPRRPGFVQYLRDLVGELARNYPGLAGVHLDYIRYPSGSWCHCTVHQQALQQTGRRLAELKVDDITDLVTALHDELAAQNPRSLLTAAVFRRGGSVSQDTYEWLRRGKLDAVLPMIYTRDTTSFADLTRDFRNHSGGRLVVPGLDAGRGKVGEQIRAARQEGAHGFAIFASSTLDATGRAEVLAETGGAYMAPARRPWKDGTPDSEAPRIHGLAQGQIAPTAAVLTWFSDEATSGELVATDPTGSSRRAASITTRGFEHRATVRGLAPGLAYQFDVIARDAAGNASRRSGSFTTPTVSSGPVTVEDGGAGFTTTGGWIPGGSSGGNDGDYLYAASRSSQESASATWTPALAARAPYEVLVHFVHGSNRTHTARYTITTSSGDQVVTVDQTQPGRWLSLGAFTLDPLSARVRLSNLSPASGVVIADAVRFVPQ